VNSPLISAALKNNMDMVKLLLESKAEVNLQNNVSCPYIIKIHLCCHCEKQFRESIYVFLNPDVYFMHMYRMVTLL